MNEDDSGPNGGAEARRSDPDTSHTAARAMRGQRAAALARRVAQAIEDHHPRGLICIEIVDITGRQWNTVSPRLNDLVEQGIVHDSGERRINPMTNSPQIVWKFGPPPAGLVLPPKKKAIRKSKVNDIVDAAWLTALSLFIHRAADDEIEVIAIRDEFKSQLRERIKQP